MGLSLQGLAGSCGDQCGSESRMGEIARGSGEGILKSKEEINLDGNSQSLRSSVISG